MIDELPPVIGFLTVGAETTILSNTIAIDLLPCLDAFVVISPHFLAPFGFIERATPISPVVGSVSEEAFTTTSPSKGALSLPGTVFSKDSSYCLVVSLSAFSCGL